MTGLQHGPVGQIGQNDQGQDHEREIFRGPEHHRHFGKWKGQEGEAQEAHRPGDEGADGRHSQGGPGPALFGHLVAVQAGDDGRGLPGDVQQNRGGRTAVLGAVINSREHDDGRDRRDLEGNGQKDGYGGHGADAGEDPDERPQENPQETVKEVNRLEGGLKSQKDEVQQVHQPILNIPTGN